MPKHFKGEIAIRKARKLLKNANKHVMVKSVTHDLKTLLKLILYAFFVIFIR
jgi:hypothetical protein